jgi:hypothetical protein
MPTRRLIRSFLLQGRLHLPKLAGNAPLRHLRGRPIGRSLFHGQKLAEHRCGYTAFTAELTGFAHEGENLIALRLDSRESLDQPPFGGLIDYLTYSGLYRGCCIEITNRRFIADAFVAADYAAEGPCVINSEVIIAGEGAGSLRQALFDSQGRQIAEKDERIGRAGAAGPPFRGASRSRERTA